VKPSDCRFLIADCRLAVGVLSHLAAVSAATKDTNRSCRKEIGNQKSAIGNGSIAPFPTAKDSQPSA
jgi:hypothetical protein